jgi:hypothetical protein
VSLPLAVVYKFLDDQGTYLAALITYYGFASLFPLLLLLLLLVTILGSLLRGDPGLQQQILHSALWDFPIIGDQIGQNIHSLHGSVTAVIIGVIGSLYSGLGVTRAGHHRAIRVEHSPTAPPSAWACGSPRPASGLGQHGPIHRRVPNPHGPRRCYRPDPNWSHRRRDRVASSARTRHLTTWPTSSKAPAPPTACSGSCWVCWLGSTSRP